MEFHCIVGCHCKISDILGIVIFRDCNQYNCVLQYSYQWILLLVFGSAVLTCCRRFLQTPVSLTNREINHNLVFPANRLRFLIWLADSVYGQLGGKSNAIKKVKGEMSTLQLDGQRHQYNAKNWSVIPDLVIKMLPGSKKRLFLSYFPSAYVRISACMDRTLLYGMVKALLSDHCHIIAVTTRAGWLREWSLVTDQAINLSIRAVIYESSVLAKVLDIHTTHSFWICLVFTLVSTNCDKKVLLFPLYFFKELTGRSFLMVSPWFSHLGTFTMQKIMV